MPTSDSGRDKVFVVTDNEARIGTVPIPKRRWWWRFRRASKDFVVTESSAEDQNTLVRIRTGDSDPAAQISPVWPPMPDDAWEIRPPAE